MREDLQRHKQTANLQQLNKLQEDQLERYREQLEGYQELVKKLEHMQVIQENYINQLNTRIKELEARGPITDDAK